MSGLRCSSAFGGKSNKYLAQFSRKGIGVCVCWLGGGEVEQVGLRGN